MVNPRLLQRIRDNDPTLTSIDLGINRSEIGDAGAEQLARALQTNTAPASLELPLPCYHPGIAWTLQRERLMAHKFS